MYSSLLLTAIVAGQAAAQFVKAPTDLITTTGALDLQVRYKEVPAGICELQEGVKSYSGYVDVEDGQHVFWYVVFVGFLFLLHFVNSPFFFQSLHRLTIHNFIQFPLPKQIS